MLSWASSVLSKVDWIGPAHGTISVDGSRAVFSGKLNLSVARMGVPLAPISGKWHGTKGLKAEAPSGTPLVKLELTFCSRYRAVGSREPEVERRRRGGEMDDVMDGRLTLMSRPRVQS